MLKLYQSNRLEYLADLLIEITRPPLADPFAAETVVVQHPGMGRWLSLQIAEQTGICANFQFPLPAGFIWDLFGRLIPGLPEQERFAPSVMQWTLFSLLGNTATEQLFQPVNRYLDKTGEHGRFELAQRLAICFDRYLVYRPDWIRAWENGTSAIANDSWQAELWRRLCRTLNTQHWVDIQRRLEWELDRHRARTDLLPGRISLFGIPALSSGYLSLLHRLSDWIDIHLFLLNPCEKHWSGIVDSAERSGRELAGESEALYLETGNPLLASLGRQGRDFLAALQELDPPTIDLFGGPGAVSLLGQLQQDMLELKDGTQSSRRVVQESDGSISVHSCHGPMREVEVLRDQLLDLLERYPDLQPDQVLVMTPDMDLYAPYVEAVFGAAGATHIPYTVADRGATLESPLTAAFLRLLEIPESRYESGELMALLEVPAIRRRFAIGDGDLAMIHRWVGQSGIRWGRDAGSRRERGLPETEQNSWQAGLDRMLLGFALPGHEERLFHGVLPYDHIEGADTAILNGLSAFLHQVFDLQRQLSGRHRPDLWGVRLTELISRFFLPEGEEETQLQRLRDQLAELLESVRLAEFGETVSIQVMRRQLIRQLESGTVGGFLGGGVNFCALTPMRSLPFQVICLLGMNDGLFPDNRQPPEFDLMAAHFRLGDRHRRLEDRYLFLETLISARRVLYISYSGQDMRDNATLPPSVFVSELLDYLDHSFEFENGVRLHTRFPVKHQLQPFHARYFQPHSRLFSYDAGMQAAARACRLPSRRAEHLLQSPLPQPGEEWRQVELERLTNFYANPTRYLLRERLGVLLEYDERALETRDPFGLDYFEQDRLGTRLIEAQLASGDAKLLLEQEKAAGRLPHGQVGEQLFLQLQQSAFLLVSKLKGIEKNHKKESIKIDYYHTTLRLTGNIEIAAPGGIFGYSFKPLPANRLLRLWITHLALNVAAGGSGARETCWLSGSELIRLPPVEHATRLLGELLDLYWEGLSTPLHLFPRSSIEYARYRLQHKDPAYSLGKASIKWLGSYFSAGEFANPYYQLAFPQGDVLDEAFQRCSEQVLAPLLSAMETS